MPFYSDEIIQELKNQADIALVIQQFLPLKKAETIDTSAYALSTTTTPHP